MNGTTPPDPGGSSAARLIRHEERLSVRTEVYARERVRLEKYVVTEERHITVRVRREEVRIVHEPMEPDAPIGDVYDGFPRVFVLSEEQVEVSTRLVPVERVWLERHRVTKPETVSADVRREEIDIAGID